jgi:hypothetical protein
MPSPRMLRRYPFRYGSVTPLAIVGGATRSQLIGSQPISDHRVVGTTDAADANAAVMHGPVQFQMT